MSTLTVAVPRRTRLAAGIALIIAVAAVLAGCSAGAGDAADSAVEPASSGSAEFSGEEAFAADDGGAPEADEASRESTQDRSIVITGALYMTVEDPIVAADRAAGIVQNAGGRIDARSETAPDEYNGGSASLTLRIPTERLDNVVDDLRDLGAVDEYSTDSYDVTNEVTDLEAKISTLRSSTQRIRALLLEAEDISDIITLEDELAGRQAQLEGLEARQRGLEDQVSMSTITLSLTTEPVVIVEEDDPETFLDGLESGWNALVAFVSGVLVLVGVMLPWITLMALIILAVVLAIRIAKSLAARRSTAPTGAPTSTEQPAQPPAPHA